MIRVLIAALAATGLSIAQVEIRPEAEGAPIRVNGQAFTTLHFGAKARKPYLHPLRSASGKIVTRGFPVDPQPGEATNSPHQLGVWVGHEKLNDIDFFEVDPVMGIAKKRKVGAVVFKDLTASSGGAETGNLSFRADWVAPDGKVHVVERRTMTFHAKPKDLRTVDLDVRLEFPDGADIADHADGLLGLRLGKPFEEKHGGTVKNFSGAVGADKLYGRRSPWIDYSATVDGEKVGVAVFDHPDNYNFPTRWKIRAFASIFASAFGEREFYHEDPWKMAIPDTAKDAGLKMSAGAQLRFRYRVIVHPAAFDADAAFRTWAAQ